MRFEWDESKNISNYNKHGIWFEEAKSVWADPKAIEFYDIDSSEYEERFIRVGYSTSERILFVVFCERDEQVVRIISARKATLNERKQFEKGI